MRVESGSGGRGRVLRRLEVLELLLGDEAPRAEGRGGGVGGGGCGGPGAVREDLLGVSAQEGDAVVVLRFAVKRVFFFFFFFFFFGGGGGGGERERERKRKREEEVERSGTKAIARSISVPHVRSLSFYLCSRCSHLGTRTMSTRRLPPSPPSSAIFLQRERGRKE